jgi:signal transduction histidine kinase
MTRPTWPMWRLDPRRAIWLTLAFWTFTFVVFQAPALKTGRLTLWETSGYLVIVLAGAALSLAIYALIQATQGLRLKIRLPILALSAMGAAITQSIVDHQVFVAFSSLFGVDAPLPTQLDAFVFNILIYVWIYGLYATVIGLVITALAMREQERRLAAANAAAQEAQLAALRFQINPHFLFNALNAVTALIGAGRNVEAETVVIRLSEFFRASLTAAPSQLVPLEEELDLVGSYLDIEAARFGDRMIVDIDLPDAVRGALVPHLLLQPLAENAVKHGVARAKHPVTISLRAARRGEDLHISVVDDGGGGISPDLAANGTGIGLANVSGRLQALFGEAASMRTSIGDGIFSAEVRMPFSDHSNSKRVAA